MRQLMLLRHAKSSWDDPALPDHARPLNARGKQAARAMRDAIGTLGLVPDVILVSSARRTLQTLEALNPWPETPLIEPLDALYLAPAERILDTLAGIADTVRAALVIGHNPGLHDLARDLAGPSSSAAQRMLTDEYPTAALAVFDVPGPWHDLAPGRARLQTFLRPRDLPGAG